MRRFTGRKCRYAYASVAQSSANREIHQWRSPLRCQTRRSTSLLSVAGRCAIEPRSAGHLYVSPHGIHVFLCLFPRLLQRASACNARGYWLFACRFCRSPFHAGCRPVRGFGCGSCPLRAQPSVAALSRSAFVRASFRHAPVQAQPVDVSPIEHFAIANAYQRSVRSAPQKTLSATR